MCMKPGFTPPSPSFPFVKNGSVVRPWSVKGMNVYTLQELPVSFAAMAL
jgi:hypothetical protein